MHYEQKSFFWYCRADRESRMNKNRIFENLVRLRSFSSSSFRRRSCLPALSTLQTHPHLHNPSSSRRFPFKPFLIFPSYCTSSSGTLRFFNTNSFEDNQDDPSQGVLRPYLLFFLICFSSFYALILFVRSRRSFFVFTWVLIFMCISGQEFFSLVC